jgi:hypothetical protein
MVRRLWNHEGHQYHDAFATNHSKDGDEGKVLAISKRTTMELPLRWGEGCGEGKGSVPALEQARTAFAIRGNVGRLDDPFHLASTACISDQNPSPPSIRLE